MENNKKYWTQLNSETLLPEFEVRASANENIAPATPGYNRREFLKLNAYAITFAAFLSSCRQPVREAIPYLIQPDEILPSMADYYATSWYDGSNYASLLSRVVDGRPVKLEGNDQCPICSGKATARAQASILGLYSDLRLKYPEANGEKCTWTELDGHVKAGLEKLKETGKKLVILTNTIISPNTKRCLEEFTTQWPNTEVVCYDEVSYNAILLTHGQCLGKAVIPSFNFQKAKFIVGFNCDFLSTWLMPAEFTRQYHQCKGVENTGSIRHIQFETNYSVTGAAADKRFPIKPSEELNLLICIYNQLANHFNRLPEIPATTTVYPEVETLARQLIEHAGESLVVSGSNHPDNQKLVIAINFLLGNYGNTIDMDRHFQLFGGDDAHLEQFVAELNDNKIGGLICLGTDPVYDLGPWVADKIKNLDFSVAVNCLGNETSGVVKYLAPTHHFLESWGDLEPKKGHYSFVQPVVQPLFETRQAEDSLLVWSGSSSNIYDLLTKNWREKLVLNENNRELNWDNLLKTGVYTEPVNDALFQAKFNPEVLNTIELDKTDGLELFVYENNNLGTGDTKINYWLHELPDPVTKISWDNCAIVSPQTARKYSLRTNGYLKINDTQTFPVFVQAGTPDDVVMVARGYGKTIGPVGKVGESIRFEEIFKNSLRQNSRIINQLSNSEGEHQFAFHQTHNSHENRLDLTFSGKVRIEKNTSPAGKEKLHENYQYLSHRWGMVIDLDLCTGCNACVVSCIAENNIPVVGKNEVIRGHNMHWLRIDRYFEGEANSPRMVNLPVMCQHCGNAPCEKVCPVAATSHSKEGLNQMIYNRCVGIRYCSANCPYKTRVFNWFDYTGTDSFAGNTVDPLNMTSDLARMVLNPDVTSRAKGVMEKCSYCIQRIEEKRVQAKKENRAIADNEIQTACMQTCPSGAIVFGDLNNPESRVAKLSKSERAIHLLDDLNTKPSVTYLKRFQHV